MWRIAVSKTEQKEVMNCQLVLIVWSLFGLWFILQQSTMARLEALDGNKSARGLFEFYAYILVSGPAMWILCIFCLALTFKDAFRDED